MSRGRKARDLKRQHIWLAIEDIHTIQQWARMKRLTFTDAIRMIVNSFAKYIRSHMEEAAQPLPSPNWTDMEDLSDDPATSAPDQSPSGGEPLKS